ncbi:hypothetical protein ACOZ4N_20075 (plasmid) [Halorientalis pallida]|uniref:hypothetical protein n=1 Tax=Halorientalis pallida TaxID=2479928 RepID=UPI003C6EBE47
MIRLLSEPTLLALLLDPVLLVLALLGDSPVRPLTGPLLSVRFPTTLPTLLTLPSLLDPLTLELVGSVAAHLWLSSGLLLVLLLLARVLGLAPVPLLAALLEPLSTLESLAHLIPGLSLLETLLPV